jgi:hypothetical protein
MQAIMLYMSGSGIQIFSMGIVWMLLTSPFKACLNIIKSEYIHLSTGRATSMSGVEAMMFSSRNGSGLTLDYLFFIGASIRTV